MTSPKPPWPEAMSACRVEFEFEENCQTVRLSFLVPDELLWSAEGLAGMFTTCRRSWLSHCNDSNEDAWESWRLVGVYEMANDDQVISHLDFWKGPKEDPPPEEEKHGGT
jgi:hypothetical protein